MFKKKKKKIYGHIEERWRQINAILAYQIKVLFGIISGFHVKTKKLTIKAKYHGFGGRANDTKSCQICHYSVVAGLIIALNY